ncbi:integrase arm-type DNA-binding domain-containing protein, partial [Helicobacter sp. 13S00477-4]|uniref:tyrosine-type recombinase/integrase n=1 Tax=Helicobacter sp. 13S00477-4 TaxID=1905759 RepID=UPI000BA69417
MTELEIKNAKAKEKNYFLSDINGLRLLIRTSGKKIFEFRYTYQKQRKITTIGHYPHTTLLQARKKALEYQELLANNKDPQAIKKEEAIALIADIEGQVHKIYEKWFDLQEQRKLHIRTIQRIKSFIENIFLPHFSKYDKERNIISSLNINDISHKDVIDIVLKYQKKSGSDLALRMFRYVRAIWNYAFMSGFLKNNPISNIAITQLLPPVIKNHYAKITDETILGELLRCIDDYKHSLMIQSALQFVALIPLRSGNLCKLKWKYIDWENKTLSIPRAEMKDNNKNIPDFKIPLSNQAINI